MKEVMYTEYRCTKLDGTYYETEATGWILNHWDYAFVEAVQYYSDGTHKRWVEVDNRSKNGN